MYECHFCKENASNRYTLLLKQHLEEDVAVCEECLADIQSTTWTKVWEAESD